MNLNKSEVQGQGELLQRHESWVGGLRKDGVGIGRGQGVKQAVCQSQLTRQNG